MKKNKGIKQDSKKLRWDLLPYKELGEIAGVLTHGANKYSDYGWQKLPNAKQRYFAAAIRHVTAWWQGEKNDQESGLSHLAHAGCCLLFLMWFDRKQK